MKKRTSEFLTVLLSLIMVFSLAGAAYAADESEESTGDIIVTAAEGDDTSDDTSEDAADDTSDDTSGDTTDDTTGGGFADGGNAGTGTAPTPGSNGGMGGSSSDEDEEIEIVYEQSSIVLAVGSDESERGITWYYPSASDGTLYLAKESELEGGEMPEDAAVYTASAEETNKDGYYSFQVTMSGLETGETYAYQLENEEVVTEVYTFTISESDLSFTFAVAGDPQIGTGSTDTDTEGWGETLEVIATNSVFSNIDFLLSVGDQVDSASSETQYNGFLEHEELLSLPLATVIGNHDTSSSAYSEHFNITNESEYGTTDAGGDYYYVYEGVLFLVLNSNNTSTAEHQSFMEEAIAATADQNITWKVVTFHHSIYSVASHAEDTDILSRRETLVPVFEELDIDVVLMGHDHVYCRTYIMDGFDVSEDEDYEYDEDGVPVSVTDTDGILYVTFNSSSGSKYYSLNGTDYEYAAVTNQERTPNISLVSVTAGSFTVTTYRTEDMSEVDSFTIYKTVETEDTDTDGTDTDGTDTEDTDTGDTDDTDGGDDTTDGDNTTDGDDTEEAPEEPQADPDSGDDTTDDDDTTGGDGTSSDTASLSASSASYTLGSSSAESVVIEIEAAGAQITAVSVGGTVLTEGTDYTVAAAEDGTCTVTFTESYLETLAAGEYDVEIYFENAVAETVITITAAEDTSGGDDDADSGEDTSDGDDAAAGTDSETSESETSASQTVTTGDGSRVFMWIYLACAAFMAILALSIAGKMRKEKAAK